MEVVITHGMYLPEDGNGVRPKSWPQHMVQAAGLSGGKFSGAEKRLCTGLRAGFGDSMLEVARGPVHCRAAELEGLTFFPASMAGLLVVQKLLPQEAWSRGHRAALLLWSGWMGVDALAVLLGLSN